MVQRGRMGLGLSMTALVAAGLPAAALAAPQTSGQPVSILPPPTAQQTPAAPQIQPAPVAGPVDLSIRNEAFAARARAEQWMKNRDAPADLPEPDASAEIAGLLPLLAGPPADADSCLYSSYAALAAALDRAGEETVFLADGRPVAWREALLHQLVQRQRIDARGGGFWADPAADDPAAARATAYALQALAIALGP